MRLAPVVYPGKMFWDTVVIKPVGAILSLMSHLTDSRMS